MKTFAAICTTLILTVISEGAEGFIWPYSRDHLRTVTPAFKTEPGPAFYEIPTTTYDPLIKTFEKVYTDVCYPVELYCYPDDSSYCIFYDLLGNIAGIQMCFLKEYADKIDSKHYSFANNSNYVETTVCNKTSYCVRVWFTNPEELKEYGRTDVTEVIEGLWANIDGRLERFDQRCQPVGPSIGSFDLQGCLPQKGTLYVRNLNKYSENCENGFYLFLVFSRNSLVGFGHAVPGYFPPGPDRDWFDHPEGEKLAQIVPSPPRCFADLVQYGLTTSVTFLVEDPYNIDCPVCGC